MVGNSIQVRNTKRIGIITEAIPVPLPPNHETSDFSHVIKVVFSDDPSRPELFVTNTNPKCNAYVILGADNE